MHLWIVDRAVDNGADPTENDGKMFEISAPDIGGTQANGAPVAVDDSASTTAGTPVTVTVPVLANDPDPDGGLLSVTNLTQPANGSVQTNPNQTVTFSPNVGFAGTDTFTYTANDGQADSNVATVTVNVADGGGSPPSAPAFRSAASSSVTKASGTTLTIARPAGLRAGDLLLAQVRHRATDVLSAPWLDRDRDDLAHDGAPRRLLQDRRWLGASGVHVRSGCRRRTDGRRHRRVPRCRSGVADRRVGRRPPRNTATLVAPNATSTVDNALVVRLWGWRGTSATDAGVGFNVPLTGVTQRWSEQVGHSSDDRNRVLAGEEVKAVAGAVGTSTASGSASTQENRRSSFTITLAPAPSA